MSINPLSTAGSGALVPGSPFLDAGSDDTGSNPANVATGGGPSFADTLSNAFNNVNTLQNQASQAATSFATGQVNDVHSVMIAAQKATVALDLTTQIRNQVVGAYQNLMQISM